MIKDLQTVEDFRRISAEIEARRQKGNVQSAPRGNKFGAIPVNSGHDHFDSTIEYTWVQRLLRWQEEGLITNVATDKNDLKYSLDVPNRFIDGATHVCMYEADARFTVVKSFLLQGMTGQFPMEPGMVVVIDVKNPKTAKTPQYLYKKRLMWACHGIKLIELAK